MYKTLSTITICFFILICVGVLATRFFDAPSKISPDSRSPSTPQEVVEKYLGDSRKGQFENIAKIRLPRSACYEDSQAVVPEIPKPAAAANPDGISEIKPRDGELAKPVTAAEIYLKWIREDYPNLIFKHDFQAEIKEVRRLENKAEVDLELKNAAMNRFPWSIVLLKERNEWKICDVTTVKE